VAQNSNLLDEVMLEELDGHKALGRKALQGPLTMDYLRDLGAEDLKVEGSGRSPPTPLQRIRETHHSLARLLAGGETQANAARLTGRSVDGVRLLLDSPAFQELVAYYRNNISQAYEMVHETLADLGKAVVEEIRDRFEITPEKFNESMLLKVAEFTLDRTLTKADAPKAPGGVNVVINLQGVSPVKKTPVMDLESEEIS
jgi:hypothetical protein